MCTCHSDSEQRLRETVESRLPAGSRNLTVELQGYVFGMSDTTLTHRASCPVSIEYETPKKSGGMKTVKQKSFLRATFCPFCGEKYE